MSLKWRWVSFVCSWFYIFPCNWYYEVTDEERSKFINSYCMKIIKRGEKKEIQKKNNSTKIKSQTKHKEDEEKVC